VQGSSCLATTASGTHINLAPYTVRYFHTDHLGSVTAITDETGLVVERLAYDAWGKRRFTNGTADVNDTVVGLTTDRGYTEHEELDELGIIHMNGRIYDPYIGRFMSADPFIQAPYELQSHNRYAYVMNNPLLYTDPSGFNWFKKLFIAVVVIVAIVVTSGAAAAYLAPATFATGGGLLASTAAVAGLSLGNAMIIGAVGGFVGSALGAAMNGASLEDSLKAGIIGGITGAAFAGVGFSWKAGSFQNYLGHAVVGCGSSLASGGGSEGCARGAASALIGKAVTVNTSGDNWNDFTRGVAATVSGGVTSRVMGGSFESGAQTAAYGYLFNQVLTSASLFPNFDPIQYLKDLASESAKFILNIALFDVGAVPVGIAGKFFEGATYTDKVLMQMKSTSDLYHGFPLSVDGVAAQTGQITKLIGNDGATYFKLEAQGALNGAKGVFEYIKNSTGQINHRLFVKNP
jgi:RHS repeat-associated protein